jgi:hypothetical protein
VPAGAAPAGIFFNIFHIIPQNILGVLEKVFIFAAQM